MFEELRREPRQAIDLPLTLADGASGIARNVSPSGMYIEIRGDRPPETKIAVEMEVPGERMIFRGEGRVVRMDHRDGVTGIAVHLESAELQPA